ncbi:beta-defensin 115 [Tupaia chinensis]|uniref:beta-defensin 115 n=1 Tax=Tupaia chinensis TaxID=246437 RepID=UPI0003C8F5FA|nr:beta-defensin 115 [Tupaia chinensis]
MLRADPASPARWRSMGRTSHLSGDILLLLLALAVLVVLVQTSPDGWIRRCFYGNGRCRKSCKEQEKKKEKCGEKLLCCVHEQRRFRLSRFPAKKENPKGRVCLNPKS